MIMPGCFFFSGGERNVVQRLRERHNNDARNSRERGRNDPRHSVETLRNLLKSQAAAQPNLTFFGVLTNFFDFQKNYVVQWLCKNKENFARIIDYQLVR
jgi:hypothetical protein